MMKQENAHSGANPETELQAEPDAIEQAQDKQPTGCPQQTPAEARPPSGATDTPASPAEVLPRPSETLAILEAQLGEALKIIEDLSRYVQHPDSDVLMTIPVADAVSRMVLASASLGKVASRLQNGETESRHRVIVEYAAPGEGVGETRKRISRERD